MIGRPAPGLVVAEKGAGVDNVCHQGAPVKGAELKRRPATQRTVHVRSNNNT